MSVLIVIPARYASTRFDGKPLAPLRGAHGQSKSLVQRCWEAGCNAAIRLNATVIVATDDRRIVTAAENFGAKCMLTPSTCRNGTERCAATIEQLGPNQQNEIVINLQGDAPLTPPRFIHELVTAMRKDTAIQIATPVIRCNVNELAALRTDRAAGRVGGTTAVMRADGRALYFSKEVLPHGGDAEKPDATPVYHHVGVYAYRPDVLRKYRKWPTGALEAAEGLEQLRFIENNCPIHCVTVTANNQPFWEVNNPSDIPIVEQALCDAGID